MARDRMHAALSIPPQGLGWFTVVATFFFTVYYFNYKVNQTNELGLEEGT